MARSSSASVIYLRLPPRASAPRSAADCLQLPLAFARTLRGQPEREGIASLSGIAPLIAQSQRVVLLFAASDVTLLRMPVPPLPAARLPAALPALVEDRVIGDPDDCAMAAGPASDGQRTIAVTDRAWLQRWLQALRQLGARRASALPMQLCLPLPPGHVSAALLDLSGQLELALRTSADDGLGLPVAADGEVTLVDAVISLLATFAGGRTVQLSVAPEQAAPFHAWLAAHPESGIALVGEDWRVWIEGASQAGIDLAGAIAAHADEPIEWHRWRWPLRLAMACLLLNVLALNWDWWRLRRDGLALRADMAAVYRRAFPGEAVPAEPLAQMRQKVAAARQAAGEFAPGDFLALSAALGEAWAEAGNDSRAIAALEYRDAVLTVRLKPGAQVSLDALGPALATRRLAATSSPADPALWQVWSAP